KLDKEAAAGWLQQVFHAQQVVELALKSAMLRTCGLVTEEFTGSTSHDLVGFYVRLVSATPTTDAQKDAMEAIPGSQEEVAWLKRAYLAARYPNACSAGNLPAHEYSQDDATHARQLAQSFFEWSKHLSDLPTPEHVPATRVSVPQEQDGELPTLFRFEQSRPSFAPLPRAPQQTLPGGPGMQQSSVTNGAPAPPPLEAPTARNALPDEATMSLTNG
ncbi:Sacs, partial [Symbiodinium necroappetens]